MSDEVGTVAVDLVGDHEGTYVGEPIMSHDGVTFVGDASKYISLPIAEYGTLLAGSTIEFWINDDHRHGLRVRHREQHQLDAGAVDGQRHSDQRQFAKL